MSDEQNYNKQRIEYLEKELARRDELILVLNLQLLAIKQIAATTFPAGSPLLNEQQKEIMLVIRKNLGMS